MSLRNCPKAIFSLQKGGEISKICPDFMASYLVFFIPSTLILAIDVYTFFVKSGLNSDT